MAKHSRKTRRLKAAPVNYPNARFATVALASMAGLAAVAYLTSPAAGISPFADACVLTQAGDQTPTKVSLLSPQSMVEKFVQAENLLRDALAKRGIKLPSYIGASLTARKGDIESGLGRQMHSNGSSYSGPIQLSATASAKYSHFAENEEAIRQNVNAVKDSLPIFAGCKEVTVAMLHDRRVFEDPVVAAIASMTIDLRADHNLREHANYRKLPDQLKQSALYINYNDPMVLRVALNNIHSAKPIDQLLPAGLPPAKRDKIIGDMNKNPKVYPKTSPAKSDKRNDDSHKTTKLVKTTKLTKSRKKNSTAAATPHHLPPMKLLNNFLEKTQEGARLEQEIRTKSGFKRA